MIDVEPLIRDHLDRRVPEPDDGLADWGDVRRRAGIARRTRRRLVGASLAVLVLSLALGLTPLGGAVTRVLGDFSGWLTGTPGSPVAKSEQEAFDRSRSDFPERPKLRELLRVRVGANRYVLQGFRSGNAVCLRLVVRWSGRTGSSLACVTRSELERSRDLVIPVKANAGFGHVGPLPRDADDPPTVPRAIASFGFVADRVRAVRLVSDRGPTPSFVANGAFLHVLQHPARGEWVRAAIARDDRGRERRVPLLVMVQGEPPLASALRARGPATVEREVRGGTIGWFVRREPRGKPLDPDIRAQLDRWPRLRVGAFARLIQPDPRDVLRMVVARRAGMPDELCTITYPSGGGTCAGFADLFRGGPLRLSWGFSGAGQQFWTVEGLASDDVARVEAFLATGERRPLPLVDNVVLGRVPAVKLPARIVGYDARGAVISVSTIRRPGRGARPIASSFRLLLRARAANGVVARLRVARSTSGVSCLEVRTPTSARAGCYSNRWRGPRLQLAVHGRGWFISGRVHPDIARIRIVYADGATSTMTPRDGYLLYAIPAAHTRDGHRVVAMVGLSRQGQRVARQDLRTR